MASAECPYCQKAAEFTHFPPFPGENWLPNTLRWILSPPLQARMIAERADWDLFFQFIDAAFVNQDAQERWRLAVYQSCGKPVAGVFRAFNYELLRILPPAGTQASPSIPEGIRKDFEEASLCLSMGAFKASVVLSRRALEGAAIEQGADSTKKLVSQLKDLVMAGKLHPSAVEVATEIRLLGNYGAHQQDDGLDMVTKEQAQDVAELTDQVLEDLYVNAARLRNLRQRNNPAAATSY